MAFSAILGASHPDALALNAPLPESSQHATRRSGDALQESLNLSFRQPNTHETSDPLDRPRGGGSRCGIDAEPCFEESLTALVPFPEKVRMDEQGQEETVYSAWGQTLESNPTLWFYFPYGAEAVYAAEFELWTEEGNRILHTTDLPLNATPGIMGYTLPPTITLEMGETYRWNLLVQFDLLFPALDELVSGRIQRVTLPTDDQSSLNAAEQDVIQSATRLAESGIWYDLLTTIATAYPNNMPLWRDAWRDVLTEVGLASIADQPFSTQPLEPIAQQHER